MKAVEQYFYVVITAPIAINTVFPFKCDVFMWLVYCRSDACDWSISWISSKWISKATRVPCPTSSVNSWGVRERLFSSGGIFDPGNADSYISFGSRVAGLEESALWSSSTIRFSFWAGTCNFSFSPAHYGDQASHLRTWSLKEQTRTYPRQAMFERLNIARASWNSSFFFMVQWRYSFWTLCFLFSFLTSVIYVLMSVF